MKEPIVLIGVGEMGGVFARAFLRFGHPVIPVTRSVSAETVAKRHPDATLVLVAVAEADLHPTLDGLPEAWNAKLALLQNELLPDDWERHSLTDPTVISVWFEKKKGQDAKVIIPSPCFGPNADLLVDSLASIDISARKVADEDAMLNELVIKNAYILTSNIAGLKVGGTVGTLWAEHREFAEKVCSDVLDIQEQLVGHGVDREAVITGMVEAFNGDPEHKCMGRSAPARLARALGQANEFGLGVETLREIAAESEAV
ncbi:MAG: hypothetical protein ACPG4N_11175 [Gammaproteobacteria bacterium]